MKDSKITVRAIDLFHAKEFLEATRKSVAAGEGYLNRPFEGKTEMCDIKNFDKVRKQLAAEFGLTSSVKGFSVDKQALFAKFAMDYPEAEIFESYSGILCAMENGYAPVKCLKLSDLQ